jgi:four helix bundle protein
MLPYERLEVFWVAEEYVAFIDSLMPRVRLREPNDADQLDRASGSIPNNISEGCADRPRRERMRFFGYSRRSVSECHTIMRRLHRRGVITETELRISYFYCDRLSGMLYKLIQAQ